MRILISPIGTRDPFAPDGTEGACLTLFHHIKPDLVYLIPTADRHDVKDSTYPNALETKRQIEALCELQEQSEAGESDEDYTPISGVQVIIKPLDINDPTDYDKIIEELEQILNVIKKETGTTFQECLTDNDADNEFFINTTSATPQIQASCILAVASGVLKATAYQVSNPRYITGNLGIREVPIVRLNESSILEKVNGLYKELMFDASIPELDILINSSQSIPRRYGAKTWQLLCKGYSALDKLDYKAACYPILEALGQVDIGPLRTLEDDIASQHSILKSLASSDEKENETVLMDIYHNADRCYSRSAYADTLARVWRLLEGGMFLHLRECYGIEPNDINLSTCQDSSIIDQLLGEGIKVLSFESSLSLLKNTLKDAKFCEFLQRKINLSNGSRKKIGNAMEKIRDIRNKSIVAHGIKTVSEETSADSLSIAKQWLSCLFSESDIDDYPFAKEKLYSIGKRLKQVI